jgi:transcriptional regulator with XRE-family HTH domain
MNRVSEAVNAAMEASELSIRQLALRVGVTYEQIRKVSRGESAPSALLLKELCAILDLDLEKMTEKLAADKIERKYGELPALMSGKNPELAPLELVWPRLTEAQKKDLIHWAQHWARQNRKEGTQTS